MRYRVTHITEYSYQDVISLCYNEACLLPISTSHQTCFKRKLMIVPEPGYYQERLDYFGNQVSFFSIQEPHQKMSVTTTSEIEVHPYQLPDISASLSCKEVLQKLQEEKKDDIIRVKEYCLDSEMIEVSKEIDAYAKESFIHDKPFLQCVKDLMTRIYTDFSYDPSFTTTTTPLIDVLKHRRGVCQDFSHLAIACVRSQGMAAKYVSGYLETLPPPGEPRLVGADASHAWFSVYDPKLGWVEFDPTNNQLPEKQYIRVAYGRDYRDVTPLKGVLFGGGGHQLSVSVDVAPMTEIRHKKTHTQSQNQNQNQLQAQAQIQSQG